jgi:glycosyltransferase involved in cell wall biosynthesis
MIGVIVPAHNEEQLIGDCLTAINEAAHDRALGGERVVVVVCADACVDATEAIALSHAAELVAISCCNVGKARVHAARVALGLEHAG